MSGYISIEEINAEKNKVNKNVKKVGGCSLCCSYCCLLTGFSGFILLGIFALLLWKQAFFEAELALLPEEQRNEEYNSKALAFLIGTCLELAIGVLSIFWIKRNNKKLALAKAAQM